MDFTVQPIKISDLLSKKTYLIPRYQREYSWNSKELIDFWNDILGQLTEQEGDIKTSEYFFGTIILIGDMIQPNKPIEIVDGQQRMTTFTIFLSALSASFLDIRETLANKVWDYVIAENDDGEEFVILKNDTAGSYFADKIQKRLYVNDNGKFQDYYKNYQHILNREKNEDDLTDEERCIKYAYEFFIEKLRENNLKDILEKYNLSHEELLKLLRDQLLNSQVIYISSQQEESVNVIFENINSKGKSLSSLDMIKNEIFSVEDKIVPKDDARETWKNITEEDKIVPKDDARETWKNITDNLSKFKGPISKEKFYRYYWISRNTNSTESELYKNFKKKINKNDYLEFLQQLEKSSELYVKVFNKDEDLFKKHNWSDKDIKRFNYSITCLTDYFSIQQSQLLILVLCERYNVIDPKKPKIKKKILNGFIKSLENFHYLYNAITSSPNNKLETRYANTARKIYKASNEELPKILEDFKKELFALLPSREKFVDNFGKLSYQKETRSKKDKKSNLITKYSLRRFEEIVGGNESLLGYSIEHIIPESKDNPDKVNNIGNMILLEEHLNNLADDKSVKEKEVIYKNSRYSNVKLFLDTFKKDGVIQFNEDDFTQRRKYMAEFLYDHISNELK